MSSLQPSETVASAIAAERLGWAGPRARRFTTGSSFHVYEVESGNERAVVRIGTAEQREILADGVLLNVLLRPRGVPLPKILVDGTAAPLPFVIMERLTGSDLGAVLSKLSPAQHAHIAVAVADAQMATTGLPRGKGFGFAPDAQTAPHRTWSDAVAAGIDRSRRRILTNRYFPIEIVEPVQRRFDEFGVRLDAFPPVAFLHDTTTKNVIVTADGQFSGIVDVDDLCFGDPRYAPALTEAAIRAFGGPVDYVDPWLAHMQLQKDDVYSFYVAAFLLGFLSEQGMVLNGNPAPSHPSERQRLMGVYRAALEQLE